MSDDGNDTVYLRAYVVREMDNSLLIENRADGDTFICPNSQVRNDEHTDAVIGEGDSGVFGIPRWLAKDRDVDTVDNPDEL